MTISKERLEKIKARAESATSGVWDVFSISSSDGTSQRLFVKTNNGPIDLAHIPKEWALVNPSNAYFLAHARTDVPDLVAEVERLRSVIKRSEIESYPFDHCPFCQADFSMNSGDNDECLHLPTCPAFYPDGDVK